MTDTALATTTNPIGADIERVLMLGDLSKLTPDQRLSYYNAVCSSMGLNPLTRPFDYISLNGKLTLYAKRDCTDQLRKIHRVSITELEPKQVGDLFVVVASAVDGDLRSDQSTGAVNTAGAKGEVLANLMMKCETKAKRRVTLSICGLGLLDETEVDTLKQQGVAFEANESRGQQNGSNPQGPVSGAEGNTQAVQNSATNTTHTQARTNSAEPDIRPRSRKGDATPHADSQTGQETGTAAREQASQPQGEVVSGEPVITDKQRKMLFAISRSAGISDEEQKRRFAEIGFNGHRDHLPRHMFQQAIDAVDPEYKFHTRDQGR